MMKMVHKIRIATAFGAVLTTPGMVMMMQGNTQGTWILMFVVGLLAAMLTCPIRLLMTPIRWAVKGFWVGLGFVGVGCVPGVLMGFGLGVFALLVAPALVTIPYCAKLKEAA